MNTNPTKPNSGQKDPKFFNFTVNYQYLPYCLVKIAKNRFVLFDRSYEQLLPKPVINHKYKKTTAHTASIADLEYSFEIITDKDFESLYRESPDSNLYFLYNGETIFKDDSRDTKTIYVQHILQKYKLPILSADYFQ